MFTEVSWFSVLIKIIINNNKRKNRKWCISEILIFKEIVSNLLPELQVRSYPKSLLGLKLFAL